MAIHQQYVQALNKSFYKAKHSFESSGGHTFKIALFDSDASLGAATTDYSTSEEITNTSGSAYTQVEQLLQTLEYLYLQQQHLQIFQM